MRFVLYKKQEEVANALIKSYQKPYLNEGHLYLSGEMGVGKTYIASSVAHKLQAKHVLIICPATVTTKWQKVFQEFNNGEAYIATPTKIQSFKTLPQAVIVNQNNAYRVLTHYFDKDQISKEVNNALHWAHNACYYTFLPKIKKAKTNSPFDFIIFDEIHTYKSTRKIFGVYSYLERLGVKTLSLTGTIFNQNLAYLGRLLEVSHPKLIQSYNSSNNSSTDLRNIETALNSYYWFEYCIWRYIAVQISLNDLQGEIKKNKKDEINQQIMPLQGIQLSPEQQAWTELVKANGKILNLTAKRIDHLITTYLDRPTQKQPIIKRHHKINSNFIETDLYLTGFQLTPIEISQTTKFKQLNDLLKDTTKTIIFVEDKQLLKDLPKLLPHCTSLSQHCTKSKIAKQINELLNTDYNTVVLTVNQVATGVDLNAAQRVIWYQVPLDVTTILQAQRRVLRLNSTKSSKVYYLFYKQTPQEQTIKEVSQAAVKNAAAYNVREKDNLAKLTQVLFNDIK